MGLEMYFENKRFYIHEQVAADAVEQYHIARQTGEHVKICLRACIAAVYLQANDETKYQQWKAIEEDECRM